MRHILSTIFEHHHWGHSHGGRRGRRDMFEQHHREGGRGRFGDRFGGGFFGGGGGMRAAKMLASGDLQLVTLALLQEKPRYGYEIIKALEEHSSGLYTPSPGMVYPALTYLEEVGYADCAVEGKKKLYSITTEGAAHLSLHRAEADETLTGLARVGKRLSSLQQQFSEEENTAEQFGHGARGAKHEWRQLKMQFRELKEELRTAFIEKLDAPMEEKQRVLDVLRRAIADIRGK